VGGKEKIEIGAKRGERWGRGVSRCERSLSEEEKEKYGFVPARKRRFTRARGGGGDRGLSCPATQIQTQWGGTIHIKGGKTMKKKEGDDPPHSGNAGQLAGRRKKGGKKLKF